MKEALGIVVLSDLTDDCIRDYIRIGRATTQVGRTINMEIGELSRAIGRTWRELWPRVKKLEERKDVGRALSVKEQKASAGWFEGSPHAAPAHVGSVAAAHGHAGGRSIVADVGTG